MSSPHVSRQTGVKRNGDARYDWFKITGVEFDPDTWRDFVHPLDWLSFGREIRRYRECGRFALEYKLRTKEGHYAHVRGYGDKIDGREWGYVMVIEPDHTHVCFARQCYCGIVRP